MISSITSYVFQRCVQGILQALRETGAAECFASATYKGRFRLIHPMLVLDT